MISIRVLLFNLYSYATTSCDKYLKGHVVGGGAGVATGQIKYHNWSGLWFGFGGVFHMISPLVSSVSLFVLARPFAKFAN